MPLSRASASIRSIRRWNAKWSSWISMVRCLAIFRLFSTAPAARQSRRHCTAASACDGPAAGMRASSRSVAASSSIHRADKAQLGATIIATTRSQYRRDAASFRRAQDQPVSAIRRSIPSDAATWPCGSERSTCISSGPVRSPCRPSAAPSDHRSHHPAACSGWPVCASARGALRRDNSPAHRRRRRPIGHRLDEPGRIGSHPGRFGNPYMDTKSAPVSK